MSMSSARSFRRRTIVGVGVGLAALLAAGSVATAEVGSHSAITAEAAGTSASSPTSNGASSTPAWSYTGPGRRFWGEFHSGYGYGYGSGSAGGSEQPGSSSGGSGSFGGGWTGDGSGSAPRDGYGSGSSGTATQTANADATATQIAGVVNIVSEVDYGQGEAAGTGMVLTSSGRILTNNHVIDGATSIKVTVLSTNKTYSAKVVGTSPSNDIAVLQVQNASGLTTAKFAPSASVGVGDSVVGVGNAENAPGTAAASGTVTAIGQSITATDEGGANPEQLTGLIETDAAILSGDSGGPLYDGSGGVIGIDTAAETGGNGATVAGYAIPIAHALAVANEIDSGADNATVHQGLPAFLGIQLSQTGTDTTIAGTVSGSAAEQAGLVAGDQITSVAGTSVTSSEQLSAAIAAHRPGERVSLTWIDGSGATQQATVTLGSGPAD